MTTRALPVVITGAFDATIAGIRDAVAILRQHGYTFPGDANFQSDVEERRVRGMIDTYRFRMERSDIFPNPGGWASLSSLDRERQTIDSEASDVAAAKGQLRGKGCRFPGDDGYDVLYRKQYIETRRVITNPAPSPPGVEPSWVSPD